MKVGWFWLWLFILPLKNNNNNNKTVVVILFSDLSLSAEEPQTPWLIANRCHNWVKVCDVSTHLSLSYSLNFNFESSTHQILLHLQGFVSVIKLSTNTLLSSLLPGRFYYFFNILLIYCSNISFLFHPDMPFPVFLLLYVPINISLPNCVAIIYLTFSIVKSFQVKLCT